MPWNLATPKNNGRQGARKKETFTRTTWNHLIARKLYNIVLIFASEKASLGSLPFLFQTGHHFGIVSEG
jgi:hypothetical protein